ncbi:hypothetical protein DQ04_01861020 [Trypanosoma grayi]|uniref:hypothetical protein n=1 Tax=Trypanosoma grayi TaxID=71804 RepID=UPI0004F42836|nr:hypothetical protein DQ04_01861020 [Trypanosoma grayi]KEG12243.1 hypothetical protein DQ04_01861020 [Trypanosoma grayi]
MATTVPEVIVVGPTRYRHFARGSRDLYAPEAMLPQPSLRHVWSYAVSREHNNAVYFHNEDSGRSLWVLPRLTLDGSEIDDGEDVKMEAVGSVASAASLRRRDTSKSMSDAQPKEKGSEARRAIVRRSIEDAVKQALEKKEVETAATLTREEVANSVSPMQNSKNEGDLPVRDRLAMWRAKRAHQQQSSGEYQLSSPALTQNSSSLYSVPLGHAGQERPPLYGQDASTVGPSGAGRAGSGILDSQERMRTVAGQNLAPDGAQELMRPKQQQDSAPLERDVYDEKRRLFLAVNDELQREKEAALRKERLALEQASRLKEVQQREEEERTRLATERRKLEQRRLELQKQALERQQALLAKTEEETACREAAAQLNSFLENKKQLEEKAEAEGRRAASFEKAITQSLMRATEERRSASVKERRIDLRILEDSEEDDGMEERREVAAASHPHTQRSQQQNQKQQEQQRGRIVYSPSLTYVGDVTSGGHNPPRFLQRQGHGKYFYDAAQKTFFDGEWADDKRNGVGALSLPHLAVEGTWRNDELDGCATFQTKRLKGTGEFVEGMLNGNAVIELDCNSVFAGRLKENGAVVDSGAMTLPSGDHVEWISDGLAEGGKRRASHHHEKNGNVQKRNYGSGSGRCRIQFSNGDVYVGEVENYRPHGTGSYRFAATGHEYVGEFQCGVLQGHGTYRFANGNVYIGQLYKGLFHGEGKYVQQDVYTYEGPWDYGTAHGNGKMTFTNGDVWEGEFDHDRRMAGRYTSSRLFQL